MKRILAPHKEQDGWMYIRMASAGSRDNEGRVRLVKRDDPKMQAELPADVCLGYVDALPGSRIISSRRVEEAVETADYLKRCAEEGLSAYWMTKPRGHEYTVDGKTPVDFPCWVIERWVDECTADGRCGAAPTLREAYYRYHAKADR